MSETDDENGEISGEGIEGFEDFDPGHDHEDLPDFEGVSEVYVEPPVEYKPAEKPILEFVRGLKSPEDNYRLMSYLFFASIVGVVVGVLMIVQTFLGPRPELHSIASKSEDAKHESKDAHAEAHGGKEINGKTLLPESDSLSLGNFNFDLNPSSDDKKQLFMKGAELEVTIMCDQPHTCTLLKEIVPVLRDKIAGLFYRLDRNDLMSKDGKARLRKKVVDAINDSISEGKVIDAFFPHLVLI